MPYGESCGVLCTLAAESNKGMWKQGLQVSKERQAREIDVERQQGTAAELEPVGPVDLVFFLPD